MTSPAATVQERYLAQNAADERVYQDLLFFYGAQRALDKIEALAGDIDPSNEADYLVFELFQGTDPQALLALAHPEDAPWIRYSLMKALLRRGATENALAFWKRILQWQVPDTLMANTLLQYALREGRFEEAGNIAAVSLKVAPKQRDVLLWKAMAQSKRALDTELYLEPLPSPVQVTLALAPGTTRDQCALEAEAISAQNFPIAEVLGVAAPEKMAMADSLGMDLRSVTLQSGQYWISAAIGACNTPLLVTVPPGRVPTFDYVQQFVLAAENASPDWALAAGRIEDMNQDNPGDAWRVARLSQSFAMERSTDSSAIDSEALGVHCDRLRSAADNACSDLKSIVRAVAAQDFTCAYLPEAVVLDLRSDDLQSALRLCWEQELAMREGAGDFESAAALVASISHHREKATIWMNRDLAEGNSILIFPDFLLFFESVALDLQRGTAMGLFDEATAGGILHRLIETLAPLDETFKRGLRAKIQKNLGDLLLPAHPGGAPTIEINRALDGVCDELATLFRGFTQDLYLALIG